MNKDELNQAIKEFIKNDYYVNCVIVDINDSFNDVLKSYYPNLPGDNPYEFFTNGNCAVYAEILHGVFGNFASYYIGPYHVVTKIGDYFYDAKGCDKEIKEGGSYYYCPDEDFPRCSSDMREGTGIAETCKNALIAIGKEALINNLKLFGFIPEPKMP